MTFKYNNVYINNTETIAGKKEKEGPLGKIFDKTKQDYYFGEKTWEQAEIKLISENIDDIKKEFKKIITDEDYKYSMIKNSILRDMFDPSDRDGISFDLNIGMAGSLDSYFHTIIDPYKYSVIRFSKIFNYYWACYFSILHDVIVFLIEHGKKDFEKAAVW